MIQKRVYNNNILDFINGGRTGRAPENPELIKILSS